MNGKQLKNSILQWAIQGKLVPQDPNDEPAFVLLEKIRAEKARLVKEGKLKKKDLEVKPIAEDEIPFEIPESWVWVRFSEVFVFNPRNVCDDNSDAGYIPMSYIEADLQNRFRFDVKKWKDVKNGLTHLANGDIAFAKITPCITNLKSAIMHDLPNGIAGGTTELNVFRVIGETMDRKYILYFHASSYFMKEAAYKGTAGQQRIISDYVLNKPFPLPPLAEQHRIVAKIEELMPLVEKYGAAQEALDEWNQALPEKLKKSILQEAIQGKLVPQDPADEPASVLLERIREEKKRLVKEGKLKKKDLEVKPIEEEEIPFEIPESWEWCRFSDLYWQLTDGTHSTPKYKDQGVPFLSVKDMSTGKLSFSNTKFISPEEHALLSQRCHPQKGDLLISKVGTTGIPLIIDTDREFSIFVSLALIKFFPHLVDSNFLLFLINSPLVQTQVKENTRGVGNKNWVLTAISNTIMALPPLAEQRRIVAKIEELFGVIG